MQTQNNSALSQSSSPDTAMMDSLWDVSGMEFDSIGDLVTFLLSCSPLLTESDTDSDFADMLNNTGQQLQTRGLSEDIIMMIYFDGQDLHYGYRHGSSAFVPILDGPKPLPAGYNGMQLYPQCSTIERSRMGSESSMLSVTIPNRELLLSELYALRVFSLNKAEEIDIAQMAMLSASGSTTYRTTIRHGENRGFIAAVVLRSDS